jgi:ABC-type transport system involved in multi-copper enzyme maturation permease subunit
MALRWEPGPVFTFEVLTGARNWRLYATRACLVLALLLALSVFGSWGDQATIPADALPAVGALFFQALVVIELIAVLLIAPAAAAGAICVDKSRGTLLHVFVTDVRDREILFGKLAARLAPVVGLVLCSIPVVSLSSFLGGIDLPTAAGAFGVVVGVGVLGCTLALVFSIWARKMHQALLPTYALLGFWAGFYPFMSGPLGWQGFTGRSFRPVGWWLAGRSSAELAAYLSNPFGAALGPMLSPTEASPWTQLTFLGVTLGLSAFVLILVSGSLRRVALGQVARPARRARPGFAAKLVNLIPGPSLDGNAVLWREWHRKKPTRWTGRLWTTYAALSGLASLWVIFLFYTSPGMTWVTDLATQVNGWEVSIGLLLLSISAATALAEERDRGSLDVIMTTPLASSAIVWGKWWGTFAIVPRLAILPIWVTAALAMVSGQWISPLMLTASILAYSAAITSVGLLAATWIPRLSRAVGVSIGVYLLVSIGACLLPSILQSFFSSSQVPLFAGGYGPPIFPRPFDFFYLASPHYQISACTQTAGDLRQVWHGRIAGGSIDQTLFGLLWVGFYLGLAAFGMMLALLSFDRCLGRVRSRAGREPRARRDVPGSRAIARGRPERSVSPTTPG